MELIQSNLGEIIATINANFWQLIIIFALILNKPYFKYGLSLLFIHLLYGYRWYIYAIIFVAICILEKNTDEYSLD